MDSRKSQSAEASVLGILIRHLKEDEFLGKILRESGTTERDVALTIKSIDSLSKKPNGQIIEILSCMLSTYFPLFNGLGTKPSHDLLLEMVQQIPEIRGDQLRSRIYDFSLGLSKEQAQIAYRRSIDTANKLVAISLHMLVISASQRALARRDNAARSAEKRKQIDPKQVAKREVYALWNEWQEGKSLHKSGAAFARSMVSKFPIESTKTVERWMIEWRAGSRTMLAESPPRKHDGNSSRSRGSKRA